MFKSGSTKLVKNLNKKHILNLVRMQPDITARKISGLTGLQISTVLYTLKSLRDKNFIRETGLGSSTIQGGKPPALWDINPDYGYIIGAELLSSELRLAVLDFKNTLIARETYPLDLVKDINIISGHIENSVRDITGSAEIEFEQILGIGIGIPGSIDCDNGIIVYSQKQDFHNQSFRPELSERLPFPIELDNDANAGALGIKWLDSLDLETANIVYMNVQQNFDGMGVGFIINHELYHGADWAAGEIQSFLPANFWQRICKRVSSECLLCADAAHESGLHPDINHIVKNALSNHRDDLFILREIAKEISKKAVLLTDLFNPDVIIIGGDICEAQPIIESVIKERLKANVISEAAKQTHLRFSPFGAYSGAYGGAALIFRKIFS